GGHQAERFEHPAPHGIVRELVGQARRGLEHAAELLQHVLSRRRTRLPHARETAPSTGAVSRWICHGKVSWVLPPPLRPRPYTAEFLLALVSLAVPCGASTIVVGLSDGSCPGAIFARIQSAIDAAVPGSTIVVCPGVYAEQLVVGKRVRIFASPGARLVP